MDEQPVGSWRLIASQTDGWSPVQLCFTTTRIQGNELPVLGVVHDTNGDWQFLDGQPIDVDTGVLLHVAHLIDADLTLVQTSDLVSGEQAWRSAVGAAWERSALGGHAPIRGLGGV